MGIEYIKIRKKELNMTTEELSSISGVSIGTLNKILAGQTSDPKFETLRAICKALGIKLSDLDDYDSAKEPDLSEDQQKLLSLFNELNAEGKEELIKQATVLVYSGLYKQEISESLREA